jgi:hypothetical protein
VDADGGELPLNSVTYRVYVDKLPGYIFQTAYGTPEHQMRIGTSTRFFNNHDRGARFPTFTRPQAQFNTVMLDSWLSVGACMRDHFGVLKYHDDGVNNIVNADGVLQNAHPEALPPLTEQDGAMSGAPDAVTVVGFADTDLSILDDQNDAPVPAAIVTNDGAWASLAGASGADPDENIVLIGQFTTDGIFDFELNIQIRRQSDFFVEKYVARDPTGDETVHEDLIHVDSLGTVATRDLIRIDDHISVYPNPTTGDILVQMDETIPVAGQSNPVIIRSLDGKIVYSGWIQDHMTSLHLSHLLSGTYMLSVEVDQKYLFTDKIVRLP